MLIIGSSLPQNPDVLPICGQERKSELARQTLFIHRRKCSPSQPINREKIANLDVGFMNEHVGRLTIICLNEKELQNKSPRRRSELLILQDGGCKSRQGVLCRSRIRKLFSVVRPALSSCFSITLFAVLKTRNFANYTRPMVREKMSYVRDDDCFN